MKNYYDDNVKLINAVQKIALNRGWGDISRSGSITYIDNYIYGIHFPRFGSKLYKDNYDSLINLDLDTLKNHRTFSKFFNELGHVHNKEELILITLDNYIMDVLRYYLPKEILDIKPLKIKFISINTAHYGEEWDKAEKTIYTYTL